MRILPWLLALGLFVSTYWFWEKHEETQQQLSILTDTIAYFEFNHPTLTKAWPVKGIDTILGPKPLELGDSLLEIHRILWTTNSAYAFTIKEKNDQTIGLEYKRFTVRNPLTQYGRTEILFAETILIPPETFQEFRKKLSAVSFIDATLDTGYMCCLFTGSLTWDAEFQKEGHLTHTTQCRQSVQFAEACEMMMRKVHDPQLQRALDAAIDEHMPKKSVSK